VKTFEEAQQELRDLMTEDWPRYIAIRHMAAEQLSVDWPEGEGMGSSDISIAAIELMRDPDWEQQLGTWLKQWSKTRQERV
jgi:hypothetical protein